MELSKEQRLALAKEAKERQERSPIHLQQVTTVEVPALIPEDLPSLPFLQDAFRFLENVLYVSSDIERRQILAVYKQAEKFLLTRLYEFEQDAASSPEQEKRIHLYKERRGDYLGKA